MAPQDWMEAEKQGAVSHAFSPYTDNGGTSLAIAGEDFCLVAADTRQSEGYSINSRYAPKAYKFSNGAVLATSGMHADGHTLAKRLEQRLEWYEHNHGKKMSVGAMAQMLSTILYQKRFFPYYTFNILGGLDEHGKGAIYTYDPVGSHEREGWRAAGSGGSLVQPFLDNQIGHKHQQSPQVPITLEKALKVAKDAFSGAAERDIYTGDMAELFIITKDGVHVEQYPLKRD
ncbi:nucleophile aminohydrolase [Cladochytrium replicatum]|nr:nucleophile aminohydrolase [Cladochytrium replicatum]